MGNFFGLLMLGVYLAVGFCKISDAMKESAYIQSGYEKVCGEHWYSGCEWVKNVKIEKDNQNGGEEST